MNEEQRKSFQHLFINGKTWALYKRLWDGKLRMTFLNELTDDEFIELYQAVEEEMRKRDDKK